MIARIWRGWTTPGQADAYQHVLCGDVLPAIEARCIAGLLQIDVLRRTADDEVEFTTVMLFDSVAAIERFAGDDVAVAHVPPPARALLARYDERVAHHDVLGRRCQPEHARGRM